jgi:hypothetical protein
MRIPNTRARGVMQTVVCKRASDYDLTRPTTTESGRFGESSETTTTVSDVSLWVYRPDELNDDTEYGDRLTGDLNALAQPEADIQVQDRLTHGVDEYEVKELMHLPDNDDKVLKKLSLEKRTNESI